MASMTDEAQQPGQPRATNAPKPSARQTRQQGVRGVLLAVLCLNVLVALGKIVFGYLSGSLAIAADGFHSLLDAGANVVALVGLAVAARPPDPNHAYGHGRYETLATLGIAGLMLLTLFSIVVQGWSRLH
jgi:cation diffusion facilitator family transporter